MAEALTILKSGSPGDGSPSDWYSIFHRLSRSAASVFWSLLVGVLHE
jgi:hypothetical protein